jgi:hypothetical protein
VRPMSRCSAGGSERIYFEPCHVRESLRGVSDQRCNWQ